MMAYDGWNLLGGLRLLWDSLGGLARWSYEFQHCGCFWGVLETGLTLVLINVKGLRREGVLREPIDSNRSFPRDVYF